MADGDAAHVIVGGGQAGAWIARTLRSEGFNGPVVLIGEERLLPYERPPLSKSVLLGVAAAGDGVLLTEAQAHALRINVQLNRKVVQIDRTRQAITCSDGAVIVYAALFLTTGSRPRRLPDADRLDPARVHYLRTQDDAQRLKAALVPGRRLAVLGGGWIGLEVAATARSLGAQVTVLEAGERVCSRSAPAVVSHYLQALHRDRGVDLRTACTVSGVTTSAEVRLDLADGRTVTADEILVGIGVHPNVELGADCGLELDNGVVVDATGRTSDPYIFAAGDVTSRFCRFARRRVRLESFANAQSQAVVAAKAALGQTASYDEVPWLWSDQYSANIQMVGYPDQAETVLRRGYPEAGSGCWLLLNAAGEPVGAVAVNAPRELREVRKALQAATPIDRGPWLALDHA
ncbi:MAG: FAD-dependent oxidoreductase [Caulobacteraceae bacterium]